MIIDFPNLPQIPFTRHEIIMVAFLVAAALLVAQFSINVFRKRELYVSSLLLLLLTAGGAYAVGYYRSIHAPEYVAQKTINAGVRAGHALWETNKEANDSMKRVARDYSNKEVKIDS